MPRLPQLHLLAPGRYQRRTPWRPGAAAAAPCAIARDILCSAACDPCLLWSPAWDVQARLLQSHLLAPGRSQRRTSRRPGAAAAAPCAIARDILCPRPRPLPALEPCVGRPGQAVAAAPPSARAQSTPHSQAPGRCRSRTLRDCVGYSLPRGLRPLPALEPCVGRPGARLLQSHLLAPGRSQRRTSRRPGAAAAAPCAIARDILCPRPRPLPALEPCVGRPGQAVAAAPPSARAQSTPHSQAPGRCRSRTLRDCVGYSLPRGLRPLPALEPCVGRPGARLPQPHILAPGRSQRRTSWRPGAAASAPCGSARDLFCPAACACCLLAAAAAAPRLALAR